MRVTPASAGQGGARASQAAAAVVSAPSLWILSPVKDLLLFVGTPALILPLVITAERFWGRESLYLFVAAFGALGHHLPGMMRAYGDRALFTRFRTRFILAPIFLVSVCVWFTFTDINVILMATYVWGVWHGLMQTYGFLRIYDAKRRSFGRITSSLDQAMCMAWFGVGVIFSATRVHYILDIFYKAGGPLVSPASILAARWVWAGITAAVTVAFLVNLLHSWKTGRPPSPVKLLLLATSISFWLYANVYVEHLLVGIVLFELFHDVQYLSIVWLFNSKRAETDPKVGSFTRFLFRNRAVLVILYLACIFAYGSLSVVYNVLDGPVIKAALGGVLAASSLLHFYYDGFIWKVREKPIRSGLGLEGGTEIRPEGRLVPSWAVHGFKWSFFVVPLLVIGVGFADPLPEAVRLAALARVVPGDAAVLFNLGNALHEQGDLEGAIDANRKAWALNPSDSDVRGKIQNNLVTMLSEKARQRLRANEAEEARRLLMEAYAVNPELPRLTNNQGMKLYQRGEIEEATLLFRSALLVQPDYALPHYNLALILRGQGRIREALAHAREAADLLPGDPRLSRLVAALQQLATDGGGR